MTKASLARFLVKLAYKIDPSQFNQIEWLLKRSNNHNWIGETQWNELGKSRHVRGQLRNRSHSSLKMAIRSLKELRGANENK